MSEELENSVTKSCLLVIPRLIAFEMRVVALNLILIYSTD